MLRLGLPIPIIVDMLKKSVGSLGDIFKTVAELGDLVFLVTDNLAYLQRIDVISGLSPKVAVAGDMAWLVECVCTCMYNMLQIMSTDKTERK